MNFSSNASLSIQGRIKSWFQNRKTEKQLIEHVAQTVDPKIETARGYRKKLQQPIQVCLDFCSSMVANIPGPIFLDTSNYYSDPLIQAAFKGNEKIEDLLKSQSLSSIPEIPDEPDRFALLTMTHRETTDFGVKQEGGVVIKDASLRSITFAEHKIVGLSTTLESARKKLEKLCFEMILEAISKELAAKRTNLIELREHRQRLHAMTKIFSQGDHPKNYFGHENYEDHEKLEKAEQLLIENEAGLALALKDNETPEDWLEVLISHLLLPEKILHFHSVTMRVDWRNVFVDASEKEANMITFAQCALPGEMIRDAVLISYTMGK